MAWLMLWVYQRLGVLDVTPRLLLFGGLMLLGAGVICAVIAGLDEGRG